MDNKFAFDCFEQCTQDAPDRTYVQAKEVRALIGETADTLIQAVRALGLKANNCDEIRKVEVAIYAYLKASNPESSLFATAEGFGNAMQGPARERVLAQAANDRDFIAANASAQDNKQ